jgi:hypothetical protein
MFTKNSSWQASQSLPHSTMMFYGDCMKMCEEFASIFGSKRNWLSCHNNAPSHASIFNGEFLKEKKTLSFPTHPTHLTWPTATFLFPRLKIPLIHLRWSRQDHSQCWTPSQNTISMTHLKTADVLGTVHKRGRKGTTLRVIVASKHKASFWPDGSTSPGNYGSQWYTKYGRSELLMAEYMKIMVH